MVHTLINPAALVVNFAIFSVKFKFHAVLENKGKIIYQKDIDLVEKERYWGWYEVIQENKWAYKKYNKLIDKIITKSIKMLFEGYSYKC